MWRKIAFVVTVGIVVGGSAYVPYTAPAEGRGGGDHDGGAGSRETGGTHQSACDSSPDCNGSVYYFPFLRSHPNSTVTLLDFETEYERRGYRPPTLPVYAPKPYIIPAEMVHAPRIIAPRIASLAPRPRKPAAHQQTAPALPKNPPAAVNPMHAAKLAWLDPQTAAERAVSFIMGR